MGSTKGLGGSILLPRRQLMAGGMAYDTPSATTEAEVMALNALSKNSQRPIFSSTQKLCKLPTDLLDPRKMHPKMMTQIVVR